MAHTFFIYITMCYATVVKNSQAEKHEKHETSKTMIAAHFMLSMTWSAFIIVALSVHLLQEQDDQMFWMVCL